MTATRLLERPTGAGPAGPAELPQGPEDGAEARSGANSRFTTPGHRPAKHDIDDDQYARMVERHIRVLGDRAAESDASVWADLVRLKDVIDEAAREAARRLHAGENTRGLPPLPYSAFADELGCTAQNVYQRWFK